jgi:hypothetical protein
MYKLAFFIPEAHLESAKQAVFKAGAGTIGEYEHCCWQTLGQGQFKPMPGSQPFIGQQDRLEVIDEYKVEMVCDEHVLEQVMLALKQAHPFETPAYEVWKLADY